MDLRTSSVVLTSTHNLCLRANIRKMNMAVNQFYYTKDHHTVAVQSPCGGCKVIVRQPHDIRWSFWNKNPIRWLYCARTAIAGLPHIAHSVVYGSRKGAVQFLYRTVETAQYSNDPDTVSLRFLLVRCRNMTKKSHGGHIIVNTHAINRSLSN